MELIIIILVAGLAGYLLAGSRFSKPIDDTAEKVTDTSKGWADSVGDWWRKRFGKRQEPQVVDVESYDSAEEKVEAEKKPAEKRPSRRKSDTASEDADSLEP